MLLASDIHWQFGTVPAGVASILTAISLLIAALSYRGSRQDARSEQARQVSVWLEVKNHRGYLTMQNASSAVVSSVGVLVRGDTRDGKAFVWPYNRSSLAPTTAEPVSIPIALHPSEIMSIATNLELYFLDSAGRWWYRHSATGVKRCKEGAHLEAVNRAKDAGVLRLGPAPSANPAGNSS